MTWFRVDDQILDNAKVEALHEALADDENTLHAAMHVWLVAGVYSARNLTDGRVRESKLRQLCQASSKVFTKAVDHLAACGLLERADGYVEMANWSEWNPTREQVEERRKKDAGRKQSARSPSGVQAESERSPSGPSVESERNPRLPSPSPSPDPRERGAAGAARSLAEGEKSGEEGAAARALEPSEAERSAVTEAVRHLPRISSSAGSEATLEVMAAVASGGGPPIAAQVRELGAVEAALVSRGDVSRRVALDLVRTFCQRAKPVALATPPPATPRGRGWREFKDAR